MSIAVLKEIKDTEQKAEEIKKQAMSDARQIINSSSTRVKGITEQATDSANKLYQQMLLVCEDDMKSDIEKIIKESEDKANKILSNAKSNLPNAVKTIAERIVSLNWQ